jgi:hypothetical protein
VEAAARIIKQQTVLHTDYQGTIQAWQSDSRWALRHTGPLSGIIRNTRIQAGYSQLELQKVKAHQSIENIDILDDLGFFAIGNYHADRAAKEALWLHPPVPTTISQAMVSLEEAFSVFCTFAGQALALFPAAGKKGKERQQQKARLRSAAKPAAVHPVVVAAAVVAAIASSSASQPRHSRSRSRSEGRERSEAAARVPSQPRPRARPQQPQPQPQPQPQAHHVLHQWQAVDNHWRCRSCYTLAYSMPAGRRVEGCKGSNEAFRNLVTDPRGHSLLVATLDDDTLLVICSRCGSCGAACLRSSLHTDCSGVLNRGAAERVRAASRGVHPAPRHRARKLGPLVPLLFALEGMAAASSSSGGSQ